MTVTQKQRFEVRPLGDSFAIVRTTGRLGHVATVLTEDDADFIARACNALAMTDEQAARRYPNGKR